VINLDDPLVTAEAERYRPASKSVTWSATGVAGADVEAQLEASAMGPLLTLRAGGAEASGKFFSAAPHQAANAAAATALGHAMGVDVRDASAALAEFSPPPMRGGECAAAGGATVIDDTYNANPDSMLAAVRALVGRSGYGRRIAVLGDMLELGSHAAQIHHRVGREVASLHPDRLICVGPLATHMAEGARAMNDVRRVADAAGAATELNDLETGDVVLVKGSRGMRMERVVTALKGEVHA
jgi:UDP-N-acetylmuramoyl-tripeptide--D-alanyl-D-alanine ligase